MHAVLTVVNFDSSEDEAVQSLHSDIIPMVKQSPGFVRGSWFGDDKGGHGLVVFDTEEQARQGVQEVGFTIGGARVVSSEVLRVHGEA
jgi:hypothetical protein